MSPNFATDWDLIPENFYFFHHTASAPASSWVADVGEEPNCPCSLSSFLSEQLSLSLFFQAIQNQVKFGSIYTHLFINGVWEGCKRLPRATEPCGRWQLPEKILNRDLETSHSARDVLDDSMSQPTQVWMPTASSKHDCQDMFGKLLQTALGWGYANRLSLWSAAQLIVPPLLSSPVKQKTTQHA